MAFNKVVYIWMNCNLRSPLNSAWKQDPYSYTELVCFLALIKGLSSPLSHPKYLIPLRYCGSWVFIVIVEGYDVHELDGDDHFLFDNLNLQYRIESKYKPLRQQLVKQAGCTYTP